MSYKIQQLKASDVALAQELFILFKHVFDEVEINASDLPSESYLINLLSKEDFCVLVAIADDKVVGGVTMYQMPMYMREDKEAYLFDLAVHENYRRQGVARALILRLKEYAKENRISNIFVEAHVEDVEAVDFYKSLDAEMEEVAHFNISV